MSSLPIAAVPPELLPALQHAPQVLLDAPTGAGKSTWLPLQILVEGNITGRVILLGPRRLVARNVAQRLTELLGERPEEAVSYRIHAETCVGPQTHLEVVTERILTRMIQRDPELAGVELVILDEFHERSLQADLALALPLDVQQGLRDSLKLLITSAVLDNDRLQCLLPEAPATTSEGHACPVGRRSNPLPTHQRFDEAVVVVATELLRHEQGSMLLFLPGISEIQRVQGQLTERVAGDIILCPLYDALPLSEQRKAILPAPAGKRKVMLATNIVETSLTTEGIHLVVDNTQEWVVRFDPRTGSTRLVMQRISQVSMAQRAGRAGHLSPGTRLHLLGKEQAEWAAAQSESEILHSDLSALLPELLQWGCHDPTASTWLDQSSVANLAVTCRLLETLSVLDGERLSVSDHKMVTLGNELQLAAMLAAAQTGDGAATTTRLAVTLKEPPRGGLADLGVVFSRQQANWQQRVQQLMKCLARRRDQPDAGGMAGLLASALADCITHRRGRERRCQLANGMGAMLDADDALGRHEWLIASLPLQGSVSSDARILSALPVGIGELTAAHPELAQRSDTVEWDEAQETLKARRRMVIGQLVIGTQPLAKPSEAELYQAILSGIRGKGLGVLNWTSETEQLRPRLQYAVRWLPEEA